MSLPIALWIWFCAYLNCVGWTLSALHQLNRPGYIIAFALGFGMLWFWKIKTGATLLPTIHLPKYRRRFTKLFPLTFLILAGLAFLGGALYPPANFDALAYRTPRVMHWLAAGQWEWIHTEFARLNTRSAGFEWLTAPLFLFTGTDRLEFLLNALAFALLPGRVFAVLVQLGVRGRTAWHWMWIFPAGYGYVLQAGSSVNDLFGTLLALCAIEFALRGSREKNAGWLLTSGLAASLMTAVKTFNLLLLLPWFIAFLPGLKIVLRRPVLTSCAALLGIGASMIPTAVLNQRYCHDWTGATLEQTPIGGGHEVVRGVANVGGVLISNLQPPIFPFTKQWADFVASTIPPGFAKQLRDNMEGGLSRFPTAELMTEESAGLGFAVSWLLVFVLVRKVFSGKRGEVFGTGSFFTIEKMLVAAVWFALFVIVTRAGFVGTARYLLPLYVLLCVPFLTGDIPSQLTRGRGWKWVGLAVFALALLPLVLTPQRPLWPAKTILQSAAAAHPDSRALERALTVYATYSSRTDGFEPALKLLPPGVTVIGFMGADDPEGALWKPFGARRVKHLQATDTAADIRARGIKYALVNASFLAHNRATEFETWRQSVRAEPVAVVRLKLRAAWDSYDWRLVTFPE